MTREPTVQTLAQQIGVGLTNHRAATARGDKMAMRCTVNELERLAEQAVALSRTAGWGSAGHRVLDAALTPAIDEVVAVGPALERTGWSRSS